MSEEADDDTGSVLGAPANACPDERRAAVPQVLSQIHSLLQAAA